MVNLLEVPLFRHYNDCMLNKKIELSEEEIRLVIASLDEELVGNCELEPDEARTIRVVIEKMSA